MTFHLCLYLDAEGYPCNRKTMRPLSMCELHRDKATARTRPNKEADQRRWVAKVKARREQAGVIA